MNKKTPIAGRLGFVICYKDGTGSLCHCMPDAAAYDSCGFAGRTYIWHDATKHVTGSVDGADACLIDVPEDLWGAP